MYLVIPSVLIFFFTGVKIVHRTKPLTVLDVGQTLHAMSQTLCHHTAYENMGADDFPVQICEPTVGELLARQVRCMQLLGVRGKKHAMIMQLKSYAIKRIMLVITCHKGLCSTCISLHQAIL